MPIRMDQLIHAHIRFQLADLGFQLFFFRRIEGRVGQAAAQAEQHHLLAIFGARVSFHTVYRLMPLGREKQCLEHVFLADDAHQAAIVHHRQGVKMAVDHQAGDGFQPGIGLYGHRVGRHGLGRR